MARFQKKTKQVRKESKMTSTKRGMFSAFSDDMLGTVVRESLHGNRFTFDTFLGSLSLIGQVEY
jgi:hypothetical protein